MRSAIVALLLAGCSAATSTKAVNDALAVEATMHNALVIAEALAAQDPSDKAAAADYARALDAEAKALDMARALCKDYRGQDPGIVNACKDLP